MTYLLPLLSGAAWLGVTLLLADVLLGGASEPVLRSAVLVQYGGLLLVLATTAARRTETQ